MINDKYSRQFKNVNFVRIDHHESK